jgi:hypothetical protein
MRREVAGVFLTVAVTAGCATPYQEGGFTGGVSASPLSESIYEIRAQGNAFISTGKIQDYALLKSAEICRQNNFTHFVPLSEKDTTKKGAIQNNTYNTNCFGYSCTTTGGGSTPYSKPGTTMRIKLLRESDGIPDTAFSCSVIYNSLSAKYIE